MLEAVDALCAEFDLHPAIEVGLVSLCRAFNLPPRTAGGVFALARSAGWVAHILEQRLAGFMIRPRARFTNSGSTPS